MSLASLAAVDSMVSTIPMVVTGGIVMKFTEQMTNTGQRQRRRQTAKRRPRKRTRSAGFGNFGNVGF